MQLIDSHGHLNFEAFHDTWEEVIERSFDKDVAAIVMPGSQYATSHRAVELARAMPRKLYAAVGLHPTHIGPLAEIKNQKSKIKTELEKIYEVFDRDAYLRLAKYSEVVAIGEVGLDTYRIQIPNDKLQITNKIPIPNAQSFLDEQERVLREFIDIALAVDKPMILHCRFAKKPGDPPAGGQTGPNPHERLIAILSDLPVRPRFVVHCYQGTKDQALRYLSLGGLISFTGTITYSDDPAVTGPVRAVPLDRLMLETDSPYLSPVPYRGEQNEPWKVIEVARRVAELKGVDLEKVADQTTANARHFFGLPL